MDRLKDIVTPRLTLRPFDARDADDMFELLSDEETCHDDGGYAPISEKDAAFYATIEKMARDAGRYSIILRESGKMIGQAHMMDALGRAVKGYEIGYVINKDYRRKGYATEAISRVIDACFAELGAEIVTGGAFTYNLVSRRVLEKLGFTYEGYTRKAAKHCAKGVVDMANYFIDPPGYIIARLDEDMYSDARELDAEAFGNNERGSDPELHYRLADNLRDSPFFIPELDLAALSYDGALLGHAIFSRLPLPGDERRAVWLASLAVRHSDDDDIARGKFEFQRRGIGAALVKRGLQIARELDYGGCLCCGNPDIYVRKMGFSVMGDLGFTRDSNVDDPEECLFAKELAPGGFDGVERVLSYENCNFSAWRRRIIVEPYSDEWRTWFEKLRDMLLPALGDACVSIEHVGSTSVPGLCAKPIIDIDIVYPMGGFDLLRERLAAIDFEWDGDHGIPGRDMFKYRGDAELPPFHLYACESGARELKRHIALRDYLRAHADMRDEYARVKLAAARKYPFDIDAYINEKSACLSEIYARSGVKEE